MGKHYKDLLTHPIDGRLSNGSAPLQGTGALWAAEGGVWRGRTAHPREVRFGGFVKAILIPVPRRAPARGSENFKEFKNQSEICANESKSEK